jgi:glycosyltransferase involved in cell wall biosynthesis
MAPSLAAGPDLRIAYLNERLLPSTFRLATEASRHTERCLRHLRACGHAVQLLRPLWPDESELESDAEWRCTGSAFELYLELRQRWRADPPDLVHAASDGLLAWAALQAAAGLGIATSADFVGGSHLPCTQRRDGLRGVWRRMLTRRLHSAVERSFVPNEEMAVALSRRGFQGLRVLEPGVDTRAFAPAWRDAWLRRAWHADPADPVLVYVDDPDAPHCAHAALATFERLRRELHRLRMVIVGDGALGKRLAGAHPFVRFAGARHSNDLARHLASADLLLCPDPGNSDRTVLMGLASGLAVVAFKAGAAARHLTEGQTGWPVPVDDTEAFVATTRRALATALPGSALRVAARERALGLNWSTALGGFEQSLCELVASRRMCRSTGVVPA